jgi:hypothetical protein
MRTVSRLDGHDRLSFETSMRLPQVAFLFLLCLSPAVSLSQGKVYLVIGSDTGIWEGLNVTDYHCTIDGGLYTDPARNAARVMDPAFRGAMTDYYGTPMKLTWWMMAGNMFRLSVNTDIPTPSTMPIYLMKRFEGDGLQRWGDELTFHFHDWYWSDENCDGVWYWNQAPQFSLVAAEFDETLAEMLIEEDLFPVSFRSGWHAMDNGWQQRLNELLPFSMHNDYPAVHVDLVEPIDNVYDWSRAPSTNIPYHPSTTDYQVPGNSPGWNLRSRYMSVADSAFMTSIFAAANTGVDQVVCLWAHLPETDFPDNLQKVNRSAHAASGKYPSVAYRYCTAVEAMQRWLHTSDTTKPIVTLTEFSAGDMAGWTVEVNEPIFQPAPVFAVKDRYEDHRLIPMTHIGPLKWQTSRTVLKSDLAAVAVAVTDSSGNHTRQHLQYLPADIYVDYGDAGYEEPRGTWSSTTLHGWGASYRSAPVPPQDSVTSRWTARISTTGLYSAFLRFPSMSSPPDTVHIRATVGAVLIDTLLAGKNVVGDQWTYLTSAELQPGTPIIVSATARANSSKTITADVLRLTPLVKQKWLTAQEILDAGELIVGLPGTSEVRVLNSGIAPASILSAHTTSGIFSIGATFPITVPGMGSTTIQMRATPDMAGALQDTLVIVTDDPRHTEIRVLITALVSEYYAVVDNGDSPGYQETGSWSYSVAWAYKTTSRYAYPAAGVQAAFQTVIARSGQYSISEIVPTTVNASDRARYVLRVKGIPVDSVFINQNTGSGSWVKLLSAGVHSNDTVSVTVTDAMSPVISGRVLRADAIRFQWVAELGATGVTEEAGLPNTTALLGNYPNPFNPATTIGYNVGAVSSLPRAESRGQQTAVSRVRLAVYDLLGREVAVLVNGQKEPGNYSVVWDASGLSSGIYLCRMSAGEYIGIKKLVLLK